MSSSSLELWLAALRAMIKCKEWSPEAEELITFMFGAETSNGSESDEDEEDEDDEEEEGKEKRRRSGIARRRADSAMSRTASPPKRPRQSYRRRLVWRAARPPLP